MAKIKTPSYSNFIQTLILGMMSWLALTVNGLDSRMSGIDKEIAFNRLEHTQFKSQYLCLQSNINASEDKIELNSTNILINRLSIIAIKHELELEVVDEEH